MRARLIVDGVEVQNPAWSSADAKTQGRKYKQPRFLKVKAGYVLTGKDCWQHCCPGAGNAAPIAEPIDDECREAVRVWMEDKRPAKIQEIRVAVENLDAVTDADARKHILHLGVCYGICDADGFVIPPADAAPADAAASDVAAEVPAAAAEVFETGDAGGFGDE